jgi:hypothetical protein
MSTLTKSFQDQGVIDLDYRDVTTEITPGGNTVNIIQLSGCGCEDDRQSRNPYAMKHEPEGNTLAGNLVVCLLAVGLGVCFFGTVMLVGDALRTKQIAEAKAAETEAARLLHNAGVLINAPAEGFTSVQTLTSLREDICGQ